MAGRRPEPGDGVRPVIVQRAGDAANGKASRSVEPGPGPGAAVAAGAIEEETEMIDPRRFDDLARRIQASLPPGLDEVREDVTRNIRAIIAAGIARMDLVEREEFDVQSAVLARTREKLEGLEHRVRQLEGQLGERLHEPDCGSK